MSADATVAIVDFGMGNLFSVYRACETVGVSTVTTDDPLVVRSASALVLPGVGAFADAMSVLHRRGLVEAIKERIEARVPVLAICLGMQLLLAESFEFGRHEGLSVIPGSVRPLRNVVEPGAKVPHIGWSRIEPVGTSGWEGSPLSGVPFGSYMYFVHSYFADLETSDAVLSWSTYGDALFCSSLQVGSVFACQFHPERSGPVGLEIYRRALTVTPGPAVEL